MEQTGKCLKAPKSAESETQSVPFQGKCSKQRIRIIVQRSVYSFRGDEANRNVFKSTRKVQNLRHRVFFSREVFKTAHWNRSATFRLLFPWR